MRNTARNTALVAVALCAAALSACSQETELECPTPQLMAEDGVLQETPDDIRTLQDRFREGFSENEIAETIRALREKYPHVGSAAIANYLTTAYCPVAREQAVGEDAQQARLGEFENSLSQILRD